jgi:hypothetical protein
MLIAHGVCFSFPVLSGSATIRELLFTLYYGLVFTEMQAGMGNAGVPE